MSAILNRFTALFIGYVGNGEEAEDITQEVFVKAWRNLKKFDRNKCFKTWIFTIAKNTSLDFLKKKKVIPFSGFENEKGENKFIAALADPTPLPDKLFERASIGEMINRAMEKLSPKYRMVLFLRYNDHFTPLEVRSAAGGTASAIGELPLTGFTFREIANILGESIDTIKTRHRRGIAILRKILQEK